MIPLSNKPLLVLYAPLNVFAGYGSRGRDLAISLIQLKEPEYDVRFISCNWGACPHGALDESNPKHKAILDRILPGGQMPKQPDVWIMCTVPNEMQEVGSKYNIIVTAGVETHVATPEFIQGCNNADLVLTSSTFGRDVLMRSQYDQHDNNTKQVIGKLALTAKIDVLFEGLDTDIYYKIDPKDPRALFNLSDIQEDFAFLSLGHWIDGELFHDRKNIATLIKVFLETFKNRKTTHALILKTSSGTASIIDREKILDKIELIRKEVKATSLPSIYLVHGDLSDDQINSLYAHPKVKAFALFGNEGFGRPYLEFSVHQKPILCSNYSGHLDFLNPDYTIQVGGVVQQVHPSVVQKNIIPAHGAWYYVNPAEASAAMKDVYENYGKYLEGAKRQAYKSRTEFSLDKMTERLKEILDANLPKVSQPISIKLPVLRPAPKLIEDVEIV